MPSASWEVFQEPEPVAAKLRDSFDLVLIINVNKKGTFIVQAGYKATNLLGHVTFNTCCGVRQQRNNNNADLCWFAHMLQGKHSIAHWRFVNGETPYLNILADLCLKVSFKAKLSLCSELTLLFGKVKYYFRLISLSNFVFSVCNLEQYQVEKIQAS